MSTTPHPSSSEDTVAHPGARESFLAVEAQAREVLRERGLSEAQIDAELARARRQDLDE